MSYLGRFGENGCCGEKEFVVILDRQFGVELHFVEGRALCASKSYLISGSDQLLRGRTTLTLG